MPRKTPPAYRSANSDKWEFKNGLYQKHLELYLDRMYAQLEATKPQSVLDAGCGEGVVYRAMRKRGFQGEWFGFDFSREAVAYARTRSPECEWVHGSAYSMPFASRSFEMVFCSEVLEHLADPEQSLRELARVSRRWLLLSVPMEPIFRTLTRLSVTLRIGGDPGHVNFWSGAAFRRFVQREGSLTHWERTTVYQIALVNGGMRK
jgi:SAM-dependent methyltransferase